MSQWETGNVISIGTRLHYYRGGSRSKPALVLVHGITDDGLCWSPVGEVLSERYDIVMVDVRGHGKSEAPDHRYSYKTMATELAGLINGLQLDRPVVLGHSMGAMITLVLAGLFPDLPRAILLEDPPPFWGANQPKPGDDENQRSMIAWMTELKRKTHSELLAEVKQLNPTWAVEELGPWADAKHRFSLRITALIESDMKAEGIPELIQHITCRSLLITADPELGAILTNDDVAGLKNLLPHLEVENIPGAGHNIRREQFKDYLGVVQNFLSVNVN